MDNQNDFERGYKEGFRAGFDAGRLAESDDISTLVGEGEDIFAADDELAEYLGIDPGTQLRVVRDINGDIVGYL